MLPGTIREATPESIRTIRDILSGDFCMSVGSWEDLSERLVELRVELDPEVGIVWVVMQPTARPSFTLQMIRDFLVLFEGIQALPRECVEPFGVLAYRSDAPGVFNRGGDLPLFLDCITRRDEELLRLYAQGCAMMSFRNRNFTMAPFVTIALIQGEALGGGFEAALSCDLVFAESRATFGFPEVLFGLFPGMGAVTYLTRRVGAREAEGLIVDGKHFEAKPMAEIGAIDALLSDGTGLEEVRTFVKRKLRRYNAWSGFHRSRRLSDPVSFAELSGIADIWVDRSMTLKASRVPRMRELIRKQDADGLQGQGMPGEAADLLLAS